MNEQDKYLIERLDRESGLQEAVTSKDQAKFTKIAHMSDPVTTYKCDNCGREEDKKADAEGNFPSAYNCLSGKCTGGRMDALKQPGKKLSTPIATPAGTKAGKGHQKILLNTPDAVRFLYSPRDESVATPPVKEAGMPPAPQKNLVSIAQQQGQKPAQAPVQPKPVPAPNLSPDAKPMAQKPTK
jgi:hypothetical protein